MSSLVERIRQAIAHTGESGRAIARKARLAESYFTVTLPRMEKDPTSSPKSDVVQRIAEATGVDLTWLMTGKGQMVAGRFAAPRSERIDRVGRANQAPQWAIDEAQSIAAASGPPDTDQDAWERILFAMSNRKLAGMTVDRGDLDEPRPAKTPGRRR
jgi:transcriptional regulator with XRE-family HTH domain